MTEAKPFGGTYAVKRPDWETIIKWEKEIAARAIADRPVFFTLPVGFEIAIIPPFSGATGRFLIRKTGGGDTDFISVLIDHHNMLGYFGQPYFEAYPIAGDIQRWPLNQSEEMIAAVVKELSGGASD